MVEQSQEIHIKTEIYDEFEETVNIHDVTVKKEEQFQDEGEVRYENVPWDCNAVEENSMVHVPIEYSKNAIIKSEMEIGESKLELEIRDIDNTKSVSKAKKKGKRIEPQTKRFHCKYCGKRFTEQKGLDWHSHLHPNELPFECRICTRRFAEAKRMKKHEVNCNVQRFECYVCRFTCLHWHWHRFLVHFRQHTGEKPFSCKCCAKRFSSQRMLKFHMKYHPNEILSKCSFCQREFPTSVEAKNHESECAVKRKMECYLCKSTFTYKSSLHRHMPQHTGLNKFKCKYCKRAFARKDYFEIHTATAHPDELQFQCIKCKHRFPQKGDADKHMKTCNRQVFQCNLCNYSTISEVYAEDHKQKHIGADEFKCWHCPEVFLQRSKLLHHVKKIHNKKHLFHCPHCGKKYHRWLFMEKHKQNCSNRPINSK